MAKEAQQISRIPSYDVYFEAVQSQKKLPYDLQKSLTDAFAKIPVSSFPEIPGGKVIEISADTTIVNAVKILSENNIMSAPVRNPDSGDSLDWRDRYLGIIDYSAIILWVLENAELAAAALSAGTATAAGVGAGAIGALGALAMGATGPVAIAGLTVAAVGAAVAGGLAAEQVMVKDAPTAADRLGEDFYNVLVQEEPFKTTTIFQERFCTSRSFFKSATCNLESHNDNTTAAEKIHAKTIEGSIRSTHSTMDMQETALHQVRSIVKSFRWAPFLPVALDSSMLSVLLLLSKYRMRNVPVIEVGKPFIKNLITQSAVVQGLDMCRGRDWFNYIAACPISDLGLPFMSQNEVICVDHDTLILEAFKLMKDNQIGGLPVVEGPERKILGNVSIRDIRYLLLKPDLFSTFRQLTVTDFMRTIASRNQESGMTRMMPPITCTRDTHLGNVIENLASRKVHRIYVVDGEGHVIGVVTLRDVISCFIFEPHNHFDNYFGFSLMEMLSQ